MQIVSIGYNLHEMSKSVFSGNNLHQMSKLFSGKSKKNTSICFLLKTVPRKLSVDKNYAYLFDGNKS